MNRYAIAILCIFSLMLSISLATAAPAPTKKLNDVMILNVEAGDSRVKLSWRLKDGPLQGKMAVKGIRIYQLKGGPETGYNIPPFTLVDDEKNINSSSTITKLKNGEQYIFQIKAYNDQNQEFLGTTAAAFPGTDPAGSPAKPSHIYAVAGDKRIAIYWERNTEVDLAGYEIYRKAPHDQDFRLLTRMLKVVRMEDKDNINRIRQAINPGMFVDTTVENGKQYQYRIRAADTERSFSEFSNIVTAQPVPYQPPSGENVLILVNDSGESEEVALHYAKLRGVPKKNILKIQVGDKTRATLDNYETFVQKPIQEYLIDNDLLGTIRYIVPCYGMPIGFAGRALDSKLADLFDRFTFGRQMGTPHPYYKSGKHFDGTYGIYLVSRIDGPTVEIAKSLVDKALVAEKSISARSGAAYFAANGGWESGYRELAETRKIAAELKIKTIYRKGEFEENELPDDALWYFTIRHLYKNPKKGSWQPGAVGYHLTSNSFYKIRKGTWDPKMKSWVEGLLEHGITATLGAVIEPYLQGYTKPDLFFNSFWSGEFNFAESFMMATPTVQWAMSAVGDPLYQLARPYSENKY